MADIYIDLNIRLPDNLDTTTNDINLVLSFMPHMSFIAIAKVFSHTYNLPDICCIHNGEYYTLADNVSRNMIFLSLEENKIVRFKGILP